MRRWWTRQSVTERVPLPHPFSWGILTLLLFALAVAIFAVTKKGIVPDRMLTQLKLSWLNSTGWMDVSAVAPAFLVVAAMLALRRTLFARLARRPGPVEITPFTGKPAGDSTTCEDVLADFRRTLTTLSLSSPLSVPNAPSSDTVLDEVKTAMDNTKNVVATAAALIRAVIQVRYAYRVSAQLRNRQGPQPCGITVSVVTLPSGRGEIETFWSDDWKDVAERAAHFVGAFILPRSRLARRPPWTAWRGLNMPSTLFHHSQLARRHLRDRQYEKALAEFYDALEIDPQNPYLRIELAQAQEQLGLFMDALATYADVVAIESWYDRGLWIRLRSLLDDDTSGQPPSWLERSPNGRSALLIARYRLVCRLAAADQLANQWHRAIQPTEEFRNKRRRAERIELSKRLTMWLKPYVQKYCIEFGIDVGGAFSSVIDEFAAQPPRMRHFLQYVACREAAYLVDDYQWSRGRRRPGMPVTQTSLSILRIWAPLYLNWAAANLEEATPVPTPQSPPTPEKMDQQLSAIMLRKPGWAREWQEYYNAACTFAVALGWSKPSDGTDTTPEMRRLTLHAVRYLERAVSCSDSSYVGTYAQWLSTGDQDLTSLRSTNEFADYLDRYLPNEEPRVPRPRELFRLIMSMHTMRLLQQYARHRAEYWEGEIRRDNADLSASRKELDREPSVRAIARRYALDDRDWRSRLDLIDEATDFACRHQLPAPSSALPQFHEDPDVHRYIVEGPRVDGENLRYPDEYYDTIVAKRSDQWEKVLMLLPEQTIGDGIRRNQSITPDSAMWFWRGVDIELNRALYKRM